MDLGGVGRVADDDDADADDDEEEV